MCAVLTETTVLPHPYYLFVNQESSTPILLHPEFDFYFKHLK
jgi:hypothetical protein